MRPPHHRISLRTKPSMSFCSAQTIYGVEAKHMASYEFEKVKILSKDF